MSELIYFRLEIRKDFSFLEKSQFHQLRTPGMRHNSRTSYSSTLLPMKALLTAKCLEDDANKEVPSAMGPEDFKVHQRGKQDLLPSSYFSRYA